MTIKYNYAGIESSTLSVGDICNKITQNNDNLRGLETQLKNSFISSGKEDDAAHAWHTQIDLLMTKIDDYQVKLNKLRTAISEAGGLMQVTDTNQGHRFLEVRI